jgi:hypothetical protein
MFACMGGHNKMDILDHGYVKLVETWGGDEQIIEAARMSTGKGFQGWDKDGNYVCTECGAHTEAGQEAKHYGRCSKVTAGTKIV